MTHPRVSVIVCAYEAEETITDCLRSLFAQTSTDLEVVVIDDGSTDSTAAVVERLVQESDVTVRLVRTSHEGLAGARNHGIAEGAGDFFSFVDADDLVEPAMVEQLLACADSTGADLVVCDLLYVAFDSGDPLFTCHEGDVSYYGGSLLERPGLMGQLGGGICNKLVHRSLFERSGLVFPAGRFFEDLWVTYRLYGEARLIEKVDEPLYRYRVGREGSIVSVHDRRYLDIVDALALTNEHYIARGEFGALRADLVDVNYYHLIFGRHTNLLLHGSRDVRHTYLKRVFAHMDRYFPGWRHAPQVRKRSGRLAKNYVFTHRPLLTLYTDLKARKVAG